MSAKDGNDFDEGSTCITQVQGLRACRNAGIPVSKEVIARAVKYIQDCTTAEGGVQYSIRGGGPRPPITAAAVACLFNSGEYKSPYAIRLLAFCEKNVWPGQSSRRQFGHWHYNSLLLRAGRLSSGRREMETVPRRHRAKHPPPAVRFGRVDRRARGTSVYYCHECHDFTD